MTRFKAVLFDFDDTLVNSFAARVEAAEKAARGILDPALDLDQIMRKWAGRPQADIWRDLLGDEQQVDTLMEGYKKWYWEETTANVTVFPGVRAMLEQLESKGVLLGIVTSKTRLLQLDHRPFGAIVEMERLGLDGIFDVVVGWEDVKESKPAAAPILFALEKLGASAQDTLMVGDSHIDITAAKRAGVASAGAGWGTQARELLARSVPDFIVESPQELTCLLT